jgi:hypothetical protein
MCRRYVREDPDLARSMSRVHIGFRADWAQGPGRRQTCGEDLNYAATLAPRLCQDTRMVASLKPMIDLDGHPFFDYKDAKGPLDPDKYVYHYTKWERLLNIMDGGFRLSVLAYMNDPRESKDWILFTASYEPGTIVDRKALDDAVADYKRRLRVGAFCLDQPPFSDREPCIRGYGRPRMWAQYAENHKGVCIVLDRESLNRAIRSRYPDHDGSWVRDGKVKYVTSYDDPASIAIKYRAGEVQACVNEYFTDYAGSLFFAKHVDWQDENEYRWVYFDADEPGTGAGGWNSPYVNIKGSVVGLVLGEDYEDSHLSIARMFAEHYELNGNVVQCRWHRLALYLMPFADEGGRWTRVVTGPNALDWQIGPARIVPYSPPLEEITSGDQRLP